MSVPLRNPDDRNPGDHVPDNARLNEGSSDHAPKRARPPAHDLHEIDAPPIGAEAGSPPRMQDPPWKRQALAPDWLPPPPPPTRTESALAALGWLVGVIVIAALGAFGSLWGVGYFSGSSPQSQNLLASDQANGASNPIASPPAPQPATSGLAAGSADDDARRAAIRSAIYGATGPVQPGVPPATEQRSISTPSAPGPQTSAPQTSAPPAPPSRPTVPQFNRQTSPDPASASAPPRPPDPAEIAVMMKTGAEYMANGKIAAARMMFQRAAEAGDATAAFALAETYDPLVLTRVGAKGGITPDVALAQRWYEKANALGSSAAQERLARLARRSE